MMEAQVSILKRKLTMYCKKLDATVATKQQENIAEGDLKSSQEAITAVETIMKKVEEVQQDYASLLDKDSQWLIKQILTKFPYQTQTKILERRCSTQEPFLMQDLLDSLEKHITCQEKIAQYTSNYGTTSSQQPTREDQSAQLTRDERPERGPPLREASPCMYCGEKHKPTSCTRYITPQQRATYLREHKLCLICASPQHSTDECHGRSCLRCQGRHHTSVCFKAQVATPADTAPVKPQRKDYAPAATAKPKAKDTDNHRQTHKSVKHLAALCQDSDMEHTSEEDVESIAEYHACSDLLGSDETYLPIGELTVHDPSTDRLRKVVALLDSGAQCSFVDQQLADEMQLPTVSTSTLRLRTFGAQQDIEVQTRRVPLKAWDNSGRPHQLQLLTHTTLTKSLQTPSLQEADLEFINENGLDVNVRRTRNVKPQIVLGSDQLWQFMHSDSTLVQLPSGLHLLPTRLGHLVTGQLLVGRQKPNTGSTDQENENGSTVVQHVKMYAISIADPNPPDKDQAAWEQFPRLNQEGQEEVRASDKKIQSYIDEEVLNNFNKTVQKRQDGYNVCLPGKDPPVELPDHKKIAAQRLTSVWTSPNEDNDLLAKYHDTFREQLELGIEEVDEEAPGEYGRCDLDPKQVALVTPNSETSPQPTTAYLDIFSDIKTSDLAGTHRIAACTRRFIHKTVVSLNKRRPSRMRLTRLFDDTIPTIPRFPTGLKIPRANRTLLKQHQLARVTTSTAQALRNLNLYDQHGLLRCRGRSGKSTLDDDALQPRYSWKMGKVEEHHHDTKGKVLRQLEQNYTKQSSLSSTTRMCNMVHVTINYPRDLGGSSKPSNVESHIVEEFRQRKKAGEHSRQGQSKKTLQRKHRQITNGNKHGSTKNNYETA
ncbi:unnamed protein product [Nippostrongylus brasiliensis]|uniref:DUF1758 domain-containing protein n=1 Tax=Nippostrongylus brasiliensis TaxID=27835 RepID=A0A0N4XZ89_NIPBR|nr:unnamed protein product [Nippostrongylus brasiliensis]